MISNRKAYNKQWRKDNPDKVREQKRRHLEKHRKEINERRRRYRKNNPGKVEKWNKRRERMEYYEEYYIKNRGEINKKKKEYSKTEEGKASKQRRYFNRQTRERETINTLTLNEWLDILKEHDYSCTYCGVEFDENTLPTKDHIIPISKGGNNIKENIVPACRSCNSKKHNKLNYGLLKMGDI